MQRLLKEGGDGLSPDFLVGKPIDGTPGALQLLNVGVNYRADLATFFRPGRPEKFAKAMQWWPDLYFVVVTDRPDSGRSCFQAICLSDYMLGEQWNLTDPHRLPGLGIWQGNVEEHAKLAERLYQALAPERAPRRFQCAAGATGCTS
jgi:hypothetical protein